MGMPMLSRLDSEQRMIWANTSSVVRRPAAADGRRLFEDAVRPAAAAERVRVLVRWRRVEVVLPDPVSQSLSLFRIGVVDRAVSRWGTGMFFLM